MAVFFCLSFGVLLFTGNSHSGFRGCGIAVRGLSSAPVQNCHRGKLPAARQMVGQSELPSREVQMRSGSHHWKGKHPGRVAFVACTLVPSSRGCVLGREAKDRSQVVSAAVCGSVEKH